ncbi:MAG: 3-phosphoshikimate 1-carboxyvinyltransferase [Treponemataceae bacterium]|nr:MAG: 3-phosphoshikimate 1-carboxyvinyltransferase [Treponemataceae bacterium]
MDISSSNSRLNGCIQVPGSKSHTIRSLILALLADGTSVIENPLVSADSMSTLECIKLFGAKVVRSSDDKIWHITCARENLHLPDDVVNVGNSGSALYFLAPLAACFSGRSAFTGDESIRKRPVNHLKDALMQLGAKAYTRDAHTDAPPLFICGGIPELPNEIAITTDGALSQYISGIMMASMLLRQHITLTLTNPKETPFLAMTRERLSQIGYPMEASSDWTHIALSAAEHRYAPFRNVTPSDWEAAAFPLVAAFITNSTLTITHIDTSDTQGDKAVVGILQQMGAVIDYESKCESNESESKYESNDLVIRGRGTPTCTDALRVNISGFPDALPALCIAAVFFGGVTLLEDAAVCRKKETDRISAMHNALTALGVKIETTADSMRIYGLGENAPEVLGSAPESALVIDSLGDHRIAMAFLTLGLALPAGKKLLVQGAQCCAVSFPDFVKNMQNMGASMQESNHRPHGQHGR